MISGQTLAVELLESLLKSKVPPALLFVGPTGVGKRTSAIRFAARVADIPPQRIESNNSADVRVFDGGKLIVGASREIESQLRWNPVAAKKRIAIIDDAHLMNSYVYNSLLKILEEPPPLSHLLLISDSPDQLPLTVKSRCQLIHFGTLSQEALQTILTDNFEASEEEARSIAGMSEGSMAKAMWIYKGAFREDLSTVHGMIQSLKAGNLEAMFIEIERWTDRLTVLRRLYLAYLFFRDTSVTMSTRLFPAPSNPTSLKNTALICTRIQNSHYAISKNANIRLVLDNLFLDMAGLVK